MSTNNLFFKSFGEVKYIEDHKQYIDSSQIDGFSFGNNFRTNLPPSDFFGLLSKSLTLEQQRKNAEEQLLLYQRMVEAEMMLESSKQTELQGNSLDFYNKIEQLPTVLSHISSHQQVNDFIYQVQFKTSFRYYITNQHNTSVKPINVGDFVIVEAERGQDLGVVTSLLTSPQYKEKRQILRGMNAENSRVRRILRTATMKERQSLVDKHKDEQSILQYCCQLAMTVHGLPISVHEVEYQFDKKKLTIYYDSATRVDFRELVRDLYAACKVRIWMEKININEILNSDALTSLRTGR